MPIPHDVTPASRQMAEAILSLVNNMDFITPCVRATTWAEINPVGNGPDRLAARIAVDTSQGGRHFAEFSATRAPTAPADSVRWWRDNRFANNFRALASRLATVPSG